MWMVFDFLSFLCSESFWRKVLFFVKWSPGPDLSERTTTQPRDAASRLEAFESFVHYLCHHEDTGYISLMRLAPTKEDEEKSVVLIVVASFKIQDREDGEYEGFVIQRWVLKRVDDAGSTFSVRDEIDPGDLWECWIPAGGLIEVNEPLPPGEDTECIVRLIMKETYRTDAEAASESLLRSILPARTR